MIAGIGIDIVNHERMARIHKRFDEKFARRILDEQEMEDYNDAPSPARFLAKRFAAKEAAAKALGTGIANGITFNMICVRHDDQGRPLVELLAKAAEYAHSIGVTKQWLSISDEQENSIALVVLETGDS
ncbi:MAG: holo-ACP synthase [Gammaproteobacteria bacterium]